MTRAFLAGLLGALFGAGLALGGMTRPAKVIGFLDVTGDWDPSLAFVMGGAIAVFAPAYRYIVNHAGPTYESLGLIRAQRIDARLIGGAVLFGVGWGLAGYCPGPAVVAGGTATVPALVFLGAMLAGMILFQVYITLSDRLHPEPTARPGSGATNQ